MTVGVVGFGHFATTVALSLTLRRHEAIQFDFEPHLIRESKAVEHWPNVSAPIAADVSALTGCDLVWIAYDTPLNAQGVGQATLVVSRIIDICAHLVSGTTVLLSSQWPVGTTKRIAARFPQLTLAYVVENIRAGHAISDFLHQSRTVVGVPPQTETWRMEQIEALLRDVTREVQWMSVESAEMSKHALNAFLALQIAFINEIDILGAQHGADGQDVARALLSDERVSPKAYLKPGTPFGGGSLQRDVITLNELAATAHIRTPILSAIIPSNDAHR